MPRRGIIGDHLARQWRRLVVNMLSALYFAMRAMVLMPTIFSSDLYLYRKLKSTTHRHENRSGMEKVDTPSSASSLPTYPQKAPPRVRNKFLPPLYKMNKGELEDWCLRFDISPVGTCSELRDRLMDIAHETEPRAID